MSRVQALACEEASVGCCMLRSEVYVRVLKSLIFVT